LRLTGSAVVSHRSNFSAGKCPRFSRLDFGRSTAVFLRMPGAGSRSNSGNVGGQQGLQERIAGCTKRQFQSFRGLTPERRDKMKTNSKNEVIARIAGPGLALAAVFALVLSGSSVGRSQSSATSPAVPAAAPAKAAPAAQAEQSVMPGRRQPGGTHEGIKVHGHWMIEVRNPDGKLVSHTEFENSLQSTGADILTGLLSGQYVPGGFQIVFNTSVTPSYGLPAVPVGLCDNGLCHLYDSRLTYLATEVCTPAEAAAGTCGLLTYAANVGTDPTWAAGFTLTGTVNNISSGGQIQSVASVEQYCTIASILSPQGSTAFNAYSPQQCGASPSFKAYLITGATLPQANGPTPCGGPGQVSCAVTVTAGQSVNVSVTISFQ
jgi:hypothetical protein